MTRRASESAAEHALRVVSERRAREARERRELQAKVVPYVDSSAPVVDARSRWRRSRSY
jgi:hypothetical protein